MVAFDFTSQNPPSPTVFATRPRRTAAMFSSNPSLTPAFTLLLVFAPIFLLFEIGQLIIAERYIGVKHLARGSDPRDLGPSEWVAFFWVAAITFYWFWMLALLMPEFGRAQAVCMLVISAIGASLRRYLGLKWCLVVLTLEGAIRIGMMVSLLGAAWRRL